MSRTPLTADAAYQLANMLIPDDGPLAVLNAIYEVYEKKLIPADVQAADDADDDEARLAAFIGHGNLRGEQYSFQKSFPDGLSEDALMRMAIDAIQAQPSGSIDEEAVDEIEISGPTTVAIMAVWQKKDGTVWTALYHHPIVTASLAVAILKEVIDDFDLDGEPPADDGASKN